MIISSTWTILILILLELPFYLLTYGISIYFRERVFTSLWTNMVLMLMDTGNLHFFSSMNFYEFLVLFCSCYLILLCIDFCLLIIFIELYILRPSYWNYIRLIYYAVLSTSPRTGHQPEMSTPEVRNFFFW
jgi:hypothetical protein